MRRRYLVLFTLCILLAIIPTSLNAQDTPTQTPTPQPEDDITATPTLALEATEETQVDPASADNLPAITVEIETNGADWPLAHRAYRNHRAMFNSRINSATVNDLEVVWAFPIPGRADFGATASAPQIAGRVVYFQNLESNVFALDLFTGNVIWETRYDNVVIGPNGPAIGYGKVFVNSSMGYLRRP